MVARALERHFIMYVFNCVCFKINLGDAFMPTIVLLGCDRNFGLMAHPNCAGHLIFLSISQKILPYILPLDGGCSWPFVFTYTCQS